MKKQGKYLYCIVREKIPTHMFKVKGLEGEEVYAVSEGDFSCLMSNTSQEYYPLWREHIEAHQRPIEEVMNYYDVLPFGFSNIADSQDQVKERILRERNNEFKELFQKYKNKTEVDVKAFWPDMQPIFQEIAKKFPALQRLKKSHHLTYHQQIAAGELVQKLLEKKKEEKANYIREALKDIAEDFKEQPRVGEHMIVNSAFLIKKGREHEFEGRVGILAYDVPDIKLRFTGPFPLYNFVNLKIHLV